MIVPLLIVAVVGCMGLLAALRPETYARYFLAEYQRRALSGYFKAVSLTGWIIFSVCAIAIIVLPFGSKLNFLAPVLTTNLTGVVGSNPAETVGQVTLDGRGNISGTETFTNNGIISTLSVTGTYTENSNCTGTWTVIPSGGSAIDFNTVVVNSGKELLLIESNNNTNTAGNAQQ